MPIAGAAYHALQRFRTLLTHESAQLCEDRSFGRLLAEYQAGNRDDDDQNRSYRKNRVVGNGLGSRRHLR